MIFSVLPGLHWHQSLRTYYCLGLGDHMYPAEFLKDSSAPGHRHQQSCEFEPSL